jgi:hypothetical protein
MVAPGEVKVKVGPEPPFFDPFFDARERADVTRLAAGDLVDLMALIGLVDVVDVVDLFDLVDLVDLVGAVDVVVLSCLTSLTPLTSLTCFDLRLPSVTTVVCCHAASCCVCVCLCQRESARIPSHYPVNFTCSPHTSTLITTALTSPAKHPSSTQKRQGVLGMCYAREHSYATQPYKFDGFFLLNAL